MDTALHFSSEKHDWTTPVWLFNRLNESFDFGLDAAASSENHLCPKFFTLEDDSLAQDWSGFGPVFVNPPYGREGAKFIAKASEEAKKGVTTVMLIPSRTDTVAWHSHIFNNDIPVDIKFLKGRLKFGGGPDNPAPFPSALIVFNGDGAIHSLDLTRP